MITLLLLTPLLGDDPNTSPLYSDADSLGPYLTQVIFPRLIEVVVILAVLAIAWWGLRYMLSNIPGVKGEGREGITNALYALLLVLAAWAILYTINPEIHNALDSFLNS